MRVDNITGRHVEVTPPLRRLVDQALAKLERILNDRAVSATVTLTKEKYRHIVEILLHARGDHRLTGVGRGNTWPLAVRQAQQKVEQQAKKLKSKWTDGRHRSARAERSDAPARADAVAGPRIVRGRYPIKPMSIDDAVLRLDSGSEAFVVFRDADSDRVTILYRRKDGNFALIDPE
ncbi:MAG TPA: HPF/RaiA family ribosome-associated protein [Vicinamibacterales bacterium]|jgi:putative sigma-54 modulation protein